MIKRKLHKSFSGETAFWTFHSKSNDCEMNLSTFVPSSPINSCLLWLSGLNCTEENFIMKSGIQNLLSSTNMMVICPDTSPRNIKGLESGEGGSFYLNATCPPFNKHYQMESMLIDDLIPLVKSTFQIKNFYLSGHSMG